MAKTNLTQRDIITALYTKVVGINGRGGMRQNIVDLRKVGQGRRKLYVKTRVEIKKQKTITNKYAEEMLIEE